MKARPYSRREQKRLSPKNEIRWVDNPPGVDTVVDFRVPEFTHLCPITGQPDVAVMNVRFIPDKRLLETRSFMQYLWTFRDKRLFHEEIVPIVLNDIVKILQPKWAQILGEFMVRGTSWERIVATHDPVEDERVRGLARKYRFRLHP